MFEEISVEPRGGVGDSDAGDTESDKPAES
jgi:hypothetical protein